LFCRSSYCSRYDANSWNFTTKENKLF
jgi:hypothetical protein